MEEPVALGLPDHPAGRSRLDLVELRVGRRFGPYPTVVDDAQLAAYAAVTGSGPGLAGLVPAGLAGVLARRAYLADYDMPPGGVMLGQDLHFRGDIPANTELLLTAEVESVSTAGRRPYVELRSTVLTAGQTVLEVLTRALWPAPEAAA
jgi:hypothetical protein